MNEPLAFLNGKWIPESQLAIGVDDLGFLLGATVTERLRTFGGKAFCVDEHLSRLRHSLEIVDLQAEGLCRQIADVLEEFIERNEARFVPGDDWAVIVFVTPGLSAEGDEPTICLHGHPLPFHQWAHQFSEGVRTVSVDARQVPANCWPAELKCRSRMHYYLADRQAARKSPGARAILLDQEGTVCEASTANVVAYFADEGLVTPPISKILPGVSQQVLFELGRELGIEHHEREITPEELSAADEVFLASTSICLLPVVSFDGSNIGSGRPGPIYQKLLAAWSAKVGVDIAGQAVRGPRPG